MHNAAAASYRLSSGCITKLCIAGGRHSFPARSCAHSHQLHSSATRSYPRSDPRNYRLSKAFKLASGEGIDSDPAQRQLPADPGSNGDDELATVQVHGPGAGSSGFNGVNRPDADVQSQNGGPSGGRSNGVTKKPTGLTPFVLPDWFLQQNVVLSGELRSLPNSGKDLRVLPPGWDDEIADASTGESAALRHSRAHHAASQQHGSTPQAFIPQEDQSNKAALVEHIGNEIKEYTISHGQWSEVVSSIAAGLSMARAKSSNSFTSNKAHIRLHCPINGSIYFQDRIVELAARTLEADLIRIDAQDLATFAHDYIQEPAEAMHPFYWTLHYDMQPPPNGQSTNPAQELEEDEDEDEGDEDSGRNSLDISKSSGIQSLHVVPFSLGNMRPPRIQAMVDRAKEMLFKRHGFGKDFIVGNEASSHLQQGAYTPGQQKDGMWNDLKLNYMLQTLVESNTIKRNSEHGSSRVAHASASSAESADPNDSTSETMKSRTIVLVRDSKDMRIHGRGSDFLSKIEAKIRDKRRQGHEIVLVGTNASADTLPELSAEGMHTLQTEMPTSFSRTIVITPPKAGPNEALFYADERRRFKEANIRNIIEAVQRLDPQPANLTATIAEVEQAIKNLNKSKFIAHLEQDPLPYVDVHRIASVAVGRKSLRNELRGHLPVMIAEAMLVLDVSDENKIRWLDAERVLQIGANPKPFNASGSPDVKLARKETKTELLVKQLRKDANRYEKRLLSGIINPDQIQTTFDKVHAPRETVQSLKTLTMLPLVRREAFDYGVLSTDKISGLLLYGPPGTGKTLLAKAVAKESGANVLEITGGDIYNMFVGEGEKNIKAVFSLAKKLSPCVVFIDEADAIFASRGGRTRNSHRELINQFLREWDGITETNAFIMVATNRPFDLDDAVLRRLPRRLLVDLPVEKDREAILRIHLKDEEVANDVSITDLAARTQLYSGSDLKNVVVSAALAAVREEYETKVKHDEEQTHKVESEQVQYSFAPRRILQKKHFEKALGEISASVSEDMSSLSAIKKFDSQYGDRRGRKKKAGFGYGSELEGEKETAKVRH